LIANQFLELISASTSDKKGFQPQTLGDSVKKLETLAAGVVRHETLVRPQTFSDTSSQRPQTPDLNDTKGDQTSFHKRGLSQISLSSPEKAKLVNPIKKPVQRVVRSSYSLRSKD